MRATSTNRRNRSELPSVNHQRMWVDMRDANMTLAEVGILVGVSTTAVWGWVNGVDTPKMKNLILFARAVGGNVRNYVIPQHRQTLVDFERELARISKRREEGSLVGLNKVDVQVIRILQQIDKIDEEKHAEEPPQHTPLKDLVENDLVDD